MAVIIASNPQVVSTAVPINELVSEASIAQYFSKPSRASY